MATPASTTPLMDVEELVVRLHAIRAICLDGPYTLKSGIISPFYIDLRLIVSHTEVLNAVSEHLYNLVRDQQFDVVCGVPYTALPMATLLSVHHGVPMVMRRKEGSKAYGLKKSIEGVWSEGARCLVVEDLVTSGLSVFETIEPLTAAGLTVADVVVLINREQGGRENIEARGVRLHALLTVTEVMDILQRRGKIGADTVRQVKEFITSSRTEIKQPILPLTQVPTSPQPPPPARLSYAARVSQCKNAAAASLLRLMEAKQSNLCLSADVTSKAALLSLADSCGPFIVALKTHVDILSDFDSSVVAELRRLSRLHNFLLFEDRKFADIGSTVVAQYAGGAYRTAEWSHITNCHILPGPGVIQGLMQAAQGVQGAQLAVSAGGEPSLASSSAADSSPSTTASPACSFPDGARGLLLIAEMSSSGALATGSYTDANVALAEDARFDEFVMGFICQRKLSSRPGLIHMTPGVQLPKEADAAAATAAAAAPAPPGAAAGSATGRTGGDSLGQQYTSPAHVIGAQGSDVIIVGRAILGAQDPAKEAKRYQLAGWQAYTDSLKSAV